MKTSKAETISREARQYVPERTCVACRKVRAKSELVRLVCSDSSVGLDPKGKKPGRGVYLCPHRECWETGLKGNRIEFGLRTKISVDDRQSLLEYGRSLPGKEDR
jgi:predicted RNA-binding protein YlxR (DUF448 family)